MAHGGGGRLMNELIRSVFLSAFGSPSGGVQNDAAVLEVPLGRLPARSYRPPVPSPGGRTASFAPTAFSTKTRFRHLLPKRVAYAIRKLSGIQPTVTVQCICAFWPGKVV